MLVKTAESRAYNYVFAGAESKKELKRLASVNENIIDHMGHFFNMILGNCALAVGIIMMLCGAFSSNPDAAIVFWNGVTISLISGGVLTPTFRALYLKYVGRYDLEKLSDRDHSIKFRSNYGYDNPTMTTSYAFNALDSATQGANLARLLGEWSVDERAEVKPYREYVLRNPDDQLFPKLKPTIDRYLAETAEADNAITQYDGKASGQALEDTKAQIDAHAKDTAIELGDIITAHEEGQRFQADRELEMANYTLSQIKIPTRPKVGELPS